MNTNQWKKLLYENKVVKEHSESVINGLTKQQARKFLYRELYPLTTKIYKDQDWRYVKQVWDMLNKMNIHHYLVDAKYGKNDDGIPSYKEWRFIIEFIDKANKGQKIQGILTAHGAGSVKDPLEKYDLTIGFW